MEETMEESVEKLICLGCSTSALKKLFLTLAKSSLSDPVR